MWTFGTDRDEHLDEHNQYDHADLASLTNGKVLGVVAGIIKQVDQSAAGGDGTDTTAIHDDTDAEISAIAAKGTPVDGDFLLIEDSGASNAKKRITIGDLPGGGGGGLDVSELSSNTILTGSGVYVVDTSSGNITITLPILSGTPSEGYRIQIIRDGANFVYLEPNAADDYWDTTVQRTLFDPYSAVSVAAGASSTSWLELGRWRTVT